MITVRSPREGGEVVSQVFRDEQARAVGENDVVLGEAFFSGGR